MDYISVLIEECNNRINLFDSGKIPEEDVGSMILDLIALIKAKAENKKKLKYVLELAETDKEREVFINVVEKQSKEKQQLEQFVCLASKRFKEPK